MFAEKVIIQPGTLSGHVTAPPSKSMTQRVLAALLLRPVPLLLQNAGVSADERVVMQVLRDAGFILKHISATELDIQPPLVRQTVSHADFGESGLAARMLTPILALQDAVVRLEASDSLRARPMRFLRDDLPRLGVRVGGDRAVLPATIHGPLQPADITLEAADTSQALSGLLMAYSGASASGVTITVKDLVSRPYIDLTLQVMETMGLPLPQNDDYRAFHFPENSAWKPAPRKIAIEGDWSGSAFLLVAGAIAGNVQISGLDAFSTQADKQVLGPLMDCGARLSIESTQVTVSAQALRAFQFNATDCPDLFPPLAALACWATGTSVIEGVSRLKDKESNRAATICSELGKMGADITLQDDLMVIRGGELKGASLYAHNDHRIAMMCAIAALRAEGPSELSGAGAVSKSYPLFWDDLQTLGARISEA